MPLKVSWRHGGVEPWRGEMRINRQQRWVGGLVLASALAGCSPPSGQFVPLASDGQPVLYIYRPYQELFGRGGDPTVFVDDKDTGYIPAGGHIAMKVAPGPHTITARFTIFGTSAVTDRNQVTYTAAAGFDRFIKVETRVINPRTTSDITSLQGVDVTDMPDSQGRLDIAKTKPRG